MIDTTLAKRYAKALVEIAQEQNALDKYAQDLARPVLYWWKPPRISVKS